MTHEFAWFDLMSPSPAASLAFYGGLLGWTGAEGNVPHYTEIVAAGVPIGGVVELTADMQAGGAVSGWLGYITVPAIDTAVSRLEAAGGRVHRPVSAIPGVGRFAVVADPQGAVYQLFEAEADTPAPGLVAPMTPGHVGWCELITSDAEAAFAFYRQQYGWEESTVMDMGEMGKYRIFALSGQDRGAVVRRPAETMPCAWLFYFIHPDIDAAVTTIAGSGGQVVFGPQQVPGDVWIVQALDPHGAMFALVGNRPNHKE